MKNPLCSKKVNALSILLDGAFALACMFVVACAALLISVHIITKDQTGVIGFQITPNESGFADSAVNFVSLFSDRIFENRFNTFVSDPYLKIGLLCSLVTAVLAAAAIRFAARPVHTLAFGGQLFSKKSVRALTVAAGILLVMAVAPALIEMGLVANGDNLLGMYATHGAVLAVILYFMSFLVACGADMLPKEDVSVEDEDEQNASRSTAISKLGQNSRAVSSLLWLAVIAVAAAAVWILVSMIPILPYLGAEALIEQNPADNVILTIMLGTVEKMQYTPAALAVRYAWELAVLVLAIFALIKGIKVLGLTKRTDTAFSDKTVKALRSCALLTLICSAVSAVGSIASHLLTGVRFSIPVCGFLCAAALYICAHLVSKLAKLREDEEKRKLEMQEDISDLSFILR